MNTYTLFLCSLITLLTTSSAFSAEITLRRMAETLEGNKTTIECALITKDLPAGKKFGLYSRTLGKITPLGVFESEALNFMKLNPNADYRGQRVEYILLPAYHDDETNSMQLITSTVPYPIFSLSTSGVEVSVELMDPQGQTFLVQLIGCQPSEKFTFVSTSGDEVIRYDMQAAEDGTWVTGIAPAVTGKTGGTATVQIIFNDTTRTETLSLSYDWGKAALTNTLPLATQRKVQNKKSTK